MGVEVTRGTAKLSRELTSTELCQLLLETIDEDHYLLTQSRGWCRLSVSLREHRHVLPLFCIVAQLFHQLLHCRTIYLLKSLFDRQRYAGVVDILRGKTKVDEFLILVERGMWSVECALKSIELLFDEVLHRLHVVVGCLLNGLHTLGILLREVTVDITQLLKQCMVEACQLRQRQLAKRDEILYLHTHAVTNKCILGKILFQTLCLTPITTVNRWNGGQSVKFHI